MVNITTKGGLITFQDTSTGVTKQIGQNRLWLMFKGDTVNFLQVDVPTDGYDGTPFFSVRVSNLTINGQSYTLEELKQGMGLDGMFSSMSFNIEIVDELPQAGDPSTIYLIYDDETGSYTEYLWLASEQVYEELGSVADVDLGNYYTKTQIDQLMAAKANLTALSAVATSGSYNDLSDKPVIPTVPTNVSAFVNDAGYLTQHQSLADYYNKSQTDNLLNGKVNTGSLATVATTGSYTDLTDKPDMSNKQDVLVSGVNIKTINSQSLLGQGNINIEGGGQATQVQSNWNETDTTSMAFIQNKPTNVSAFTNDAGYLTSHQSLADVFGKVAYDSNSKRINFYGKDDTSMQTVLGYVDASSFVVDGMVEDVKIENGNLIIDFNTDSGITDISIPLTNIFNPNNYYTKSEIDNTLTGYATSSDLSKGLDGVAPYVYTLNDKNPDHFDEVIDALKDGRNIILQENSYFSNSYPTHCWYDENEDIIYFTRPYIDSNDNTSHILLSKVSKTTAKAAASTIDWETIEIESFFWYEIGDTTVEEFDKLIAKTTSEIPLIKVFDNDGDYLVTGIKYCEDDYHIQLSWLDGEGNPVSYQIVKQEVDSGAKAPVEPTYEIVWTDVSPQPATVTVDSTWVQNSTNPVQSQLIQTALASKADSSALSDYATTQAMTTALAGKQDTLTAGTNITISNGVISATGGSQITVDSALSSTSTNPVQNAVIYAAIGDIEAALQAINGTTNS